MSVVAAVLSWLVAVGVGGALGWKWQLGVLRAAVWLTLVSLVTNTVAALLLDGIDPWLAGAVALVATGMVSALTIAYRFFRDPDRTPPDDPLAIVSSADGTVVYVRRSTGGDLPVAEKKGRQFRLDELTRTSLASGDAIVIGVGLSFLDVHVNRAPVSGRLALCRTYPGAFGSLRLPEMVFENERATMVFEQGGRQVAVVMIASRLVRRIVRYVEEGASVGVGQRIGMIRFGSQVDVVIPLLEPVDVCVEPGQRVTAGETVIARYATPGSGLQPAPTGG
jgi:phosphatidylserine decarboxylase